MVSENGIAKGLRLTTNNYEAKLDFDIYSGTSTMSHFIHL